MANKFWGLIKNKSVQYTLLSAVASALNFITLIIFGRVFNVGEYGIITTMQALVANIAVLMTPLQIIICKTMAEGEQDKFHKMNSIINLLMIINAIEFIVFIIASTHLLSYLHLTHIAEYMLFVVLVFTNNIYIVVSGVSQGKQDFLLLGIVGVVLYSTKMIAGVVLGLAGIGPASVIVGFAVAEIICICLILKKIREILSKQVEMYRFSVDQEVLKSYMWTIVLYLVVSLYMNNGDLLLGNLYCSQKEIGLYSVAINLAKISIFLIATPAATILLPKVAAYTGNKKQQRKILFVAETVTFFISALYGIGYFVLGKWLITLLYGGAYEMAADYIMPCVMFSTVLGMFWVFYQYAFATELMKSFTIVSVLIGIIVVGIVLAYQCEMTVIPMLMTGAMIISVVLVLTINAIKDRKMDIDEKYGI